MTEHDRGAALSHPGRDAPPTLRQLALDPPRESLVAAVVSIRFAQSLHEQTGAAARGHAMSEGGGT